MAAFWEPHSLVLQSLVVLKFILKSAGLPIPGTPCA
jgi:hypothetical protein